MKKVAALLLAVVFSCKSGDGTSGGASGGGPGGGDPTSFLADLCAAYAPCCASATAGSDCKATTAAIAKGRSFAADRAATCLAAVKKAPASTFCLEPAAIACTAVFKDATTKNPGATCTKSAECSNGTDGDGLCIDDHCRRITTGKAGDACLGTRSSGTIEKIEGGPVAPAPAAVCEAEGGLYCDDSSGTCKNRGSAGAECSGADVSCADAAWCPTDKKQCTPRTATNMSCVDPNECALGAQCANDEEGGGACTAFAKKGDECPRGDECDIGQGLVCNSDTTLCSVDASVFASTCTGMLALTP